MKHNTLADYLFCIGIIGTLEIGSRWKKGICEFGMDLGEIAHRFAKLIDSPHQLWPLGETDHPLFCNRGRRSLDRGTFEAREILQAMTWEAREKMLLDILTNKSRTVDKKHACRSGGNLGSLWPAVVKNSGEQEESLLVSPWYPVLVWEAQRLIVSVTGGKLGFSRPNKDSLNGYYEKSMLQLAKVDGDVYVWRTVEWEIPITVAEVFLILNGGLQRWHYAGMDLPYRAVYYSLRDSTGAGKTLEFVKREEWTKSDVSAAKNEPFLMKYTLDGPIDERTIPNFLVFLPNPKIDTP